MTHLRRAGFAVALAGTFVLGGFILPDPAERASPRLFQDVFTLVSRRYVDSLDVTALYEKAARGLVEQIQDPYAALYSPEEMEEFTVAHEGKYAGVGMLVEDQNGVTVVARVFPNTPAEQGGMMAGDRIVAVDGEMTRGWPLEKVTGLLKGEPGTLVEVRFQRPGASDAMVKMTRAIIHIPAVPYAMMLEGGAGYVPLLQFNETSAEEVAASVERLMKEGARSLVLDLRGNGGGLVSDAVEIAGLFLPKNTPIAIQRERGDGDLVYRSPADPIALQIPLVVLVDGASASASEIVAGALQDHDRAVVVGTGTFGKGLVQSAYRLDGGYLLKITTGQWFTPSGRTIHRDRTVVDGRLVAESDSVVEDTSRAGRPEHRTPGNRIVYGGGGIMPDVLIRSDTLNAEEQALMRAILPQSQNVHIVLGEYAHELKNAVMPGFQVSQAWRNELHRRLVGGGVTLDRQAYDAAASQVDRLIRDRVARLAFGDAAAKQMALQDDAQLKVTLDMLRQSRTQQDLFAAAARIERVGN